MRWPESTLRQAAEFISQEEESGTHIVLKAAEEYRTSNIILDQQNMDGCLYGDASVSINKEA